MIYTTLQAINHYKYTQNTRHQELPTHFINQTQYKIIYKTLVIKDILYKSCNCIFYAYQYQQALKQPVDNPNKNTDIL